MGPGDHAPDFTLPDEHGQPRALDDFLAQGPVVLFFYPAASSPGCTKEACHFRDLAAEFAELGAQRVGVSADAVDRQAAFTGQHGFDFPLLSDADGAVAKAYGVRRPGPLPNRRATFVIDADRTLLEVITSELSMDTHADDALAALRQRV
ncbi:MAG: peroxiredoxin [Egibacteraceae bacterium]